MWILLVGPVVAPASQGTLLRNKDDAARAERRLDHPLQGGRPVEQVTKTNREKRLEIFICMVAGERYQTS